MSRFDFYRNIFPADLVVRFGTCNGRFPFVGKSLAVRWGEIVVRHERFKTLEEAQAYLTMRGFPPETVPELRLPLRFKNVDDFSTMLKSKAPHSIHFGPIDGIYAPLVFDVDLDHRKVVRTCACEGKKKVCDQCWPQFMRPKLVPLLAFLRRHFECVVGFYSGGRGFHLWVLDERVWRWNRRVREVFVSKLPPGSEIDIDVTLNYTSHLLKIPLGMHNDTGVISMPIMDADTFVPSMAPTYATVSSAQMSHWASYVEGFLPK
jgi:hypothetical protein